MSNLKPLRWTGAFGIAAFVLILAAQPLWLVSGTAPQLADSAAFSDFVTNNSTIILSRSLADTLIIVCFLVFLAGFRYLIHQARPDYEWAAALVFGVGLVWAVLVLIGDTLVAGAALDTTGKADPAVVTALWEASIPAFGAIGLIIAALFLASAGYAILATRALPRWTGWTACAAAVLNLAAAPSIYAGANVTGFYTADGLVTVATLLPLLLWLLVVGLFMVTRRQPAAVPTPAEPELQAMRL